MQFAQTTRVPLLPPKVYLGNPLNGKVLILDFMHHDIMISFVHGCSWMFMDDTVDRENPAYQLRLVADPSIYRFFMPAIAGFLPSTVPNSI